MRGPAPHYRQANQIERDRFSFAAAGVLIAAWVQKGPSFWLAFLLTDRRGELLRV